MNYFKFSDINFINAHLKNEEEIDFEVARAKDKYYEKPDILKGPKEKGHLTDNEFLTKIYSCL